VEEVLEALDLSPEEPSLRFLERLFARFNAKVPFETASKILRNADVLDPAEKPRVPEVFWRDFLDAGTGGTCFARVAAFDALLSPLGFSTRKVLGRVEADFDHAALLVGVEGREWIADVGFPLPALLRAREGETETALAAVAVGESERGFLVRFLSGVPDGPRKLEVFRAPVSEEEFRDLWRKTFRPDSKFVNFIGMRRQEASRIVSFTRGEARVDDLHSRLRVPILAGRARRLSELFEIEQELLARAFSIAGDPDPEIRDARIEAYLATDRESDRAFGAIARPEGYRELMKGVADFVAEERTETGWRVRLAPPGASSEGFEEEVEPDAEHRTLRVQRRHPNGSVTASSYRVESRGGETYLIREAVFVGPREDLLVNDYARGRLAGTLAVDLLAWARMLGS